jgi:hypothetical protein
MLVSAAGFELEPFSRRLSREAKSRFRGAGEGPETTQNDVSPLVSAAGFEPATHALKGRCSTN